MGGRQCPAEPTMDDCEEILDLVDDEGAVIGRATRAACHQEPGLVHRVVHVMVFNRDGELFLQKRSPQKEVQPGKWDNSVGGHVRAGEAWEDALRREMAEEIGICDAEPELMFEYVWRGGSETQRVRTYRLVHDGPFDLQPEEIEDGRFWATGEIGRMIATPVFSPNFVSDFRKLSDAGG
jgi:isopentenyl-diphosphate delta-isomerase type 1